MFLLEFSADGRQILSSGVDGSVALWDAATALPVAKVYAPAREFDAVSATFADDHTVLIADCGRGRRVDLGHQGGAGAAVRRRAAGRDLTPQEWQDNFGDLPYQKTC